MSSNSSYPKEHKQIVKDLLDGKFVLSNDPKYDVIRQYDSYYSEFFQESFDYRMVLRSDYVYLVSDDSNEQLSRDISIFLAVLCYELDKDGRNFLDSLSYDEFEYKQIDYYFENTSYREVVLGNKQLRDKASRVNFYNMLNRRNIAEKTGEDRFMFTSAFRVFVDFAIELAKSRTTGEMVEETVDNDSSNTEEPESGESPDFNLN
jgi:hypothetical protein